MRYRHALIAAVIVGAAVVIGAQQDSVGGPSARLAPTAHAPVPTDLSAMWLVPAESAPLSPALKDFVRGVKLLDEDAKPAAALPLLSAKALQSTPLADYARYYAGQALFMLQRYDEADAIFAQLASSDTEGHLPEDSALKLGEVREARKDFTGAVAAYEALVQRTLAQPHIAWLRLGLASREAGNRDRAIEALRKVYFDYPLNPEAVDAGKALAALDAPLDASLAPRELARAEALFRARRWDDAKASYDKARPLLDGADKDLAAMRRAACDVRMGRYRDGRDGLRTHLGGPLGEEAGYYFVTATRGLKLDDEYVRRVRAFADEYPGSPWVEEALNGLASAHIIDDEDDEADAVFREMLVKFPKGRYAERAAWKAGWLAYRKGRFDEAVTFFDAGAAAFPRSDYRPSWLYWSGRAAEQAGNADVAARHYRLAVTDYHNSYYGRLALRRLGGVDAAPVPASVQRDAQPSPPAVPTARRIELLVATGLDREARAEIVYAQRTWGDSPKLQATFALVERRLGNVRSGINAMKRAYPQYLAKGGEALPEEILQVIFPVDYWPLLRKYAAAQGLDPYVVAALVAQESNFDPLVRSSANAVGLMQVLPSTGRAYARRMGIRPFSAARLTNADINVRIGTKIFADTIKKFGGVHFALAAYNAGDSRVAAWQRERPSLPQDEFIDDIPFPETQNYVKRILGTADDYRRLYGTRGSN